MTDADPNSIDDDQEIDEQDDAVIGKAFMASIVVFVIVAVFIGGIILYLKRPDTVVVDPDGPPPPPPIPPAPKFELPKIPFVDVTESSGITFIHESGAAGEKLLPETMGGGAAVLDFDADGDQDIIFVNSTRWPWEIARDETPVEPATMSAWRNDGDWKFTDVTKELGLDLSFYGQGIAVGDYDNDGDPDLYFSAVGANHLLRNDGGRFVDVTDEAGVAGKAEDWGTSCGWFDYDDDGDVDLLVCNYVEWNRDFDKAQPFQLVGDDRAYGRPQAFNGTFPYLFRNEGNGTFTEVAEQAGLHMLSLQKKPMAKSLGLTFCDFDNDGRIDVLTANDTVQNFLFRNLGNGKFEEIGSASGIAFDDQGRARGAMGTSAAWFRNDDSIGVAIGNFATEMTALYVSLPGTTQFSDEAVPTGLGPQTLLELTFGVCWADFDLDGRQDLLTANGHLENEIHLVLESQQYEQPPQLFWNCGPDSENEFLPLNEKQCGDDFFRRMVGRGVLTADFDLDGDPDALIVACGQAPRLLRNEQQLENNWVRFEFTASEIGTIVELSADGITQRRQIVPTMSYLCQGELAAGFGLGSANRIDSLRLLRPGADNEWMEIDAPDINQTHRLTAQ